MWKNPGLSNERLKQSDLRLLKLTLRKFVIKEEFKITNKRIEIQYRKNNKWSRMENEWIH
jgi:hypothetical protein